jgi:hypothetical protein
MAQERCMQDKHGYTHAQKLIGMRAPTHAYIHTEKCVIRIAFPQEQWFRERAPMLCDKYIACLVLNLSQ